MKNLLAASDDRSDPALRDLLVSKIIAVSALLSVAAFCVVQVRSLSIGLHVRDGIQLIATAGLVVLAFSRRWLNTSTRARLLIVVFFVGGVSGVYTLGMLGGTMFIFLSATLVSSILYSERTTLILIGASVLVFLATAFRFSSGLIPLSFSADFLLSSVSHWTIYILCVVFFYSVLYIVIYNYRRANRALLDRVRLQRDELEKSNEELIRASKEIKTLGGLLPICSACKKIRDDKGYWSQIESYIGTHTDTEFTHGICPDCMKELYPDYYEEALSPPTTIPRVAEPHEKSPAPTI